MNTCEKDSVTIFDTIFDNNVFFKECVMKNKIEEIVEEIFEIAVQTSENNTKIFKKREKSLKKEKKRRDPCIVCDSNKHSFDISCKYFRDIGEIIKTILDKEVTLKSGCEIISANDKKHIKGYYIMFKKYIKCRDFNNEFSFPVIKDNISKISKNTLLSYCISMYTYLKNEPQNRFTYNINRNESIVDNIINTIIDENMNSKKGCNILVNRRKDELKSVFKKMKLMYEIQSIYTENVVLRNISYEELKRKCETLYYSLRGEECCVCYELGVKFKKINCWHKICEDCALQIRGQRRGYNYIYEKKCPICREIFL